MFSHSVSVVLRNNENGDSGEGEKRNTTVRRCGSDVRSRYDLCSDAGRLSQWNLDDSNRSGGRRGNFELSKNRLTENPHIVRYTGAKAFPRVEVRVVEVPPYFCENNTIFRRRSDTSRTVTFADQFGFLNIVLQWCNRMRCAHKFGAFCDPITMRTLTDSH